MKLLAKARFNAHERLIAKASATNFSLQIANLYTIALSIFVLQFKKSEPVASIEDALNFVSILASVFVQIVALVESFKDYAGRAKAMHACGIEVNELVQDLQLVDRLDFEVLRHYNREYNRIIKETDSNHNNMDYEQYMVEQEFKNAQSEMNSLATQLDRRRHSDFKRCQERYVRALCERRKFWLRHYWNVYALTLVIVSSPSLVLAALLWCGI